MIILFLGFQYELSLFINIYLIFIDINGDRIAVDWLEIGKYGSNKWEAMVNSKQGFFLWLILSVTQN